MGLTRFELVTPRLSSVCSNQLSYRPQRSCDEARMSKNPTSLARRPVPSKLDRTCKHQPGRYQIRF